ncbi:MAG TPA: thioredoxin family protein, partial [Alphaproteobacteria bacterium]|nr:thioredoxin family protein [Alphaproteobacteria bacterium]
AATVSAMTPAVVGQPAPNVAAIDSNGKAHKLSDFAGRTVVLEWSNHECPYVKKHYNAGNMQATQGMAVAKGAVWLTVVSSAPGKQGAVTGAEANTLTADRKAKPTAVLLDSAGTIGKAFGARTTPHMFVIDGKGIIRYAGAIDDKPSSSPDSLNGAKNFVLAALNDLSAGKAPATAETEPYGCSVKY